jgi:16S rRNA (guanine966-N2)-methyltransferase
LRICGGEWRGRALRAAEGLAFRPTQERVREALFSRLGGAVAGGTVIDLFAGSGALGLEALSRGARRAIFVERAPEALAALRANVDALAAQAAAEIVAGDVLAFLAGRFGRHGPVSLVLADPPYAACDAELPRRIAEAPGLAFCDRVLLVLESSTRAPEPEVAPGWRRWPGRAYGETRLTIDEWGPEHGDVTRAG